MIVYHIDRTNSLKPGQEIVLDYNFKPNNDILPDLVQTLNLYGISEHGKQYLNDRAYFSNEPACYNDIDNSNSFCSQSIIEYLFELIRQLKYSHMPSRFSSLFALEKLEDLEYWPEFKNNQYNIYEIEISYTPIKLDAYYLKGGIAFSFDSPSQFHQGFSPSLNSYFATKYWTGAFSDTPKPELMLSLPLTIGKRIMF